MRTEFLRAERAVEPDGEEAAGVGDGDQERFGALAGEQASAGVTERGGDHDRDIASAGSHCLLGGKERGLAVQRVEHGFDQDDVRARVEHGLHAGAVGRGELVERDVAGGGVLHVGRHAGGASGGADASGDEARFGRIAGGELVGDFACVACAGERQVVHAVLQSVVELGEIIRVERIGLDDVRPGLKIGAVDGFHQIGTRDVQHIVITGQRDRVRREFSAVEVCRGGMSGLKHRAHGAVQDKDFLCCERSDFL